MDDIPTPILLGAVAVVIIVAVMTRRNDASSGVTLVPSDPGAVSIAQAQIQAQTQAFGDIASFLHDTRIAELTADAQNHAVDVSGATAEYIADKQASAAQSIASIQAELERERLASQSALGSQQISAENHATNVGGWLTFLNGLFGLGAAIFGNRGQSSSSVPAFGSPSFAGPSFGGYGGGFGQPSFG